MAWVESHQSLTSHPKTRKAARTLGIPVPHVVGHLHCLWHRALDIAEDGDLSKFDAEDIAIAAEWDGDAEAFVQALVDCGPGDSPGFLERGGYYGDPDDGQVGQLVLHDWWDYAGKLIARRRKDRQRKADQRSSASTEDVQGTSVGRPEDRPQDGRLVGSTVGGSASTDTRADAPGGARDPDDDAETTFADFWDRYPRGPAGKKGGDGPRKPAWQRWRRMQPAERDAALVAVDHYRDHVEARDGPKAAHAVTWLNQERWDQWQEPANPTATTPRDNVVQLSEGGRW